MGSDPFVPGTPPVLEVSGLDKSFAGVHALRGVDFSVLPGEVHALIGENGAGKSTLIKVMTGVYEPDAGEVRFRGEPVAFATPLAAQEAGISTIYQEINLVPMMSVARNLFLGREPQRFGLIDSARMKREAREVLAEYGVHVNPSRPLRSLGLGAQQMVAIARAVQLDARVVIMDEPTSSLEQREVETLFEVISRLKARGIAIVYVSHRLDELYRICDRVTVMRDGEVVRVDSMAAVERLTLISLMLGREIGDIKAHGTTELEPHDVDESAAPVISARDLQRRHQLDGVSVDVRPGEVVGLGGLLGAGRSETAKAIMGALTLDGGEVEIAGKATRRTVASSIRAGVVMLPEDRKAEGIAPGLSVRENIVLAALPRITRAGLVDRRKQDEIVDYFMKRLRIKASSPDQKVSELSGGNQQKVLLARCLCLDPKALLLDEPTRGIDVGAKAEVQGVIDELAQQGLGVLLISSELDELIEGSDRVVVLKDGRVVGELTGDQVTQDALMTTLAEAPTAPELEPQAQEENDD
ncbi:monosaccharide ABC transporter ATP-binding protein (CUT2 family) [Luteimicrobium subarcticum]|uniref:Monosaccharide ABC transporter ATP-binding protein (CUT2 family) n=2 Tax=Luteimicrobium subarcticum TaxID=620910 RepID=A0A2M8WSL4_9MICO|nr:monosaccharide ABC transporter ATP-binding protein (CUT2 family) [Luteimicrobium subarcticum]